jgi:hypothetical protein
MASLSVTRSYADGEILLENDLDAFLDDIETFLNSTRINDDNIQDSGITGSSKIVNASITGAKLANGAISTIKIADDSVTKDKIAADVAGLGLAQNADGSLEVDVDDSTIEISSDNIRVKDLGITTAKINDLAVTSAKIAAGAVGTTQLLDSNVTTAKLANDAVTNAKTALTISSSTETVSDTDVGTSSGGSGENDTFLCTELQVAITTVGNPVLIVLQPTSVPSNITSSDGGSAAASAALTSGSAGMSAAYVLYRGATALAKLTAASATPSLGQIMYFDIPAAGTYTYSIRVQTRSTTTGQVMTSTTIPGFKLFAQEL